MGLVARYAHKISSNSFWGTLDSGAGFKGSIQGYWPLQEPSGVRYDFRLNNNLTPTSVPGQATGPGGAYPNAASFDGTDDTLSVADNATISAGTAANGSFSLWAWVFLTSKASTRTFISKWGDPQSEYVLRYNSSTDRFEFLTSSDGTGQDGSVSANTFGSPSINTWYFVHARFWTEGNQMGISVNNGTVDTSSNSLEVFNGTAALHIGSQGGATEFWIGRIAGAAFVRGISSAGELTAIYNSGVPVSPLSLYHNPDDAFFVFPKSQLEYGRSQAFRSPKSSVAGADYQHRLLVATTGLKAIGNIRIRFLLNGTGTDQDAMLALLHDWPINAGIAKLWSIGDDGSERWCYVELDSLPEVTIGGHAPMSTPVVLSLNQLSNWRDKYETRIYVDAGANAVVTAGGNARIDDAVVEAYADSWTNVNWNNSPTFYGNQYTGIFDSARDISTNLQRVRADAGRHFVGYSTDNGQTFAQDFANYTRSANQSRLVILIPGGNVFAFNNSRTNSRALIRFFNSWHN